MSESGDYDPGVWRGHDFGSARDVYDAHAGRNYDDAKKTGRDPGKMVPRNLVTESESPLVIACDVTGSMGEWPATIFSKLPYLDLEGQEYLGKGMEISFAAIGDAYCDDYPLQVQPFSKGKGLEASLKKLIIEGGGGGQKTESYDIGALYYARNVEMPNAIKPMFIFIGDEGLYDFVNSDQAKKWARTSVQGRMNSMEAIAELQKKYSVYLIRKPYSESRGDGMSTIDMKIHSQWSSCLGEDHIAILPEAGRVVDVIFGIMAQETSRVEYFREELTGRQKPDQVRKVLRSLNTIHNSRRKDVPKLRSGMSITKRGLTGKKGKSLI
jgi:hypothetical protein